MTFEKVKETIVDTVNCDEEAVVLEAALKEDLATFVTVKDIVNYIDKNVA